MIPILKPTMGYNSVDSVGEIMISVRCKLSDDGLYLYLVL